MRNNFTDPYYNHPFAHSCYMASKFMRKVDADEYRAYSSADRKIQITA